MVTQNELTQDQLKQIAKWKGIIASYEAKREERFSSAKIQELLDEIQSFIRYDLPEHLFTSLKNVTDAIFEASLVLAEPEKWDDHHQKASHLLYLAIKELCKEQAC